MIRSKSQATIGHVMLAIAAIAVVARLVVTDPGLALLLAAPLIILLMWLTAMAVVAAVAYGAFRLASAACRWDDEDGA